MPGMYFACIYDDDWFVGNVIEISEQYNEIHSDVNNGGSSDMSNHLYVAVGHLKIEI